MLIPAFRVVHPKFPPCFPADGSNRLLDDEFDELCVSANGFADGLCGIAGEGGICQAAFARNAGFDGGDRGEVAAVRGRATGGQQDEDGEGDGVFHGLWIVSREAARISEGRLV